MEVPGDPEFQEAPPLTESEDADPPVHRVTFQGDTGEFFRIWIVNMLLSLMTLGVYSAWATVRNRRYLYGSIELAGDRLDFHGKPLAILRGRILAVLFFLAYAFGGDFHYAIPAVTFLLLIVLFPWILVTALRFRLSNTSWRNLRFGFKASPREAYARLGLPVVLALAAYAYFFYEALGVGGDDPDGFSMTSFYMGAALFLLASVVIVPLAIHRIRDLIMNSISYGVEGFRADIQMKRFFWAYLAALAAGFAAVVAVALFVGFSTMVVGKLIKASFFAPIWLYVNVLLMYLLLVPAYLLPVAIWKVKTGNHVICSTRIRGIRFQLALRIGAYWWIMLSNAFVAVLSLGLAFPWVKIRMIRYKLSCLSLEGGLDAFSGSSTGIQSATGDEIGDAFDLDFGF